MGEALITRRGGNFDLTSLSECEVYDEYIGGSITGGQVTIPDTVDLAHIKVMFLVFTGSMVMFTSDGTIIYDSTTNKDMNITITDRTIKYNRYNTQTQLLIFY